MRRIVLTALLCLASVAAYAAGEPLPSGYLSVSGNQIVSSTGANVRLACISYNNTNGSYNTDMATIRSLGFNCIRYPYYDVGLSLTALDAIVTAASSNDIRVIFDHQGNENDKNCLSRQSNGLWYDKNGSTENNTNNTDGCGMTGTITYDQFKANWITIATRYAHRATVIGLDLHNEPLISTGQTIANASWGASTDPGRDMQAMCQDVGNAIHTANPGVLIICEGPINNTATLMNGNPVPQASVFDLSAAQAHPVTIANKVVYSVHDYPASISGITPDSGSVRIASNNASWGYLVTNGIAPVWIGMTGASLDNSNGNLPSEQAWASTLVNYANGLSGGFGGPVFSGKQQQISTSWWNFGYLPTQTPDGILNADNTPKSGQQAYWTQLLYHSSSTQTSTTWNTGDVSNMTLSSSNLVATSSTTTSTYITPGSGSFTDASGNVYTISSGDNALENGNPISGGGGTGAMEFYAGQVYAQDAVTGAWYTFDGAFFNATSAPPIPTVGAGVRTTSGRSSGLYCIAVTENTTTNHMAVAIASSAESLTASPGSSGPSVGIFGGYSGQQIYAKGSVVASNPSIANLANGDIVTVVVDATNSLIWFSTPEMVSAGASWNHSATANPTNRTGGISIAYITKPYYLMASTQEGGSIFTLNPAPSNCPSGVPTWDSVIATNPGRPMIIILGMRAGSLLLPQTIDFHLN